MKASATSLVQIAFIGLAICICPQAGLASPTQLTDLKVLEDLLSRPEMLATKGALVHPPFDPSALQNITDQRDLVDYFSFHDSRPLLNAIYSWAFFTEDSIPSPFGNESKANTSLQCAQRYILESVNNLLTAIPENRRARALQSAITEIRFNVITFAETRKIYGIYAPDDLLLTDQKLEELFQKAHSAVASKLQPFTSATDMELHSVFDSARECTQPFDVASALPWFDHQAIIELATSKRTKKETATQLSQIFETTKLPEAPTGKAEFKEFTFAPVLGLSIKRNSRISDNFLTTYWKMVPEKAYDSGYVTAKTCAAIYPYLVWGSLFGLQVTGESARQLNVTADVFKDWMTLRTTVAFGSAHDSGCEASLHFIEALWPEADHEISASTYEELWEYRLKASHFFEFSSYQLLDANFTLVAQINLITRDTPSKWAKATVSNLKSW